MENLVTTFILGLSVMFFGMTAWVFFRVRSRLSFLVASLMSLLGVQCLLSLGFIFEDIYFDASYWRLLTSIDIVAVPFYALVLRELVRPGSVSLRTCAWNVLPFLVVSILYVATDWMPVYWLMMIGAGAYGTAYLIWTHINIGIYNEKLKEQYSYIEDINLNWLRWILIFFFVLLVIWTADTVLFQANMDWFYLMASMIMWMIIDFFIYKHNEVMKSLNVSLPAEEVSADVAETDSPSDIGLRIERLFTEEHAYLNPNLKISDVATAIGSNRTYVSKYFNREASTTFFDYVNRMRIDHACLLLRETNESVRVIAEKSGFNSPQVFIRAFTKIKGTSPSDFRQSVNG